MRDRPAERRESEPERDACDLPGEREAVPGRAGQRRSTTVTLPAGYYAGLTQTFTPQSARMLWRAPSISTTTESRPRSTRRSVVPGRSP